MLVWVECAAVLLLALSQPFWTALFPFSPEGDAQPSPAALSLCALALLLSAVGILFSLPRYRRLPASVWFGWSTRVLKERTSSLPAPDLLLGLTYVPLFQPNKIRAGKMLIRGMDSTAALSVCVCLLLACAALVASCVTGDSPETLLGYACLLAALAASWSVAVFLGVRSVERKQSGDTAANGGDERPSHGWILQLPLLVLLCGLSASLLPVLFISLDSTSVSGFARALYAFVRAAFLTVVLYLLLHAPLKLALLAAPRKAHLAPAFFYSVMFLGYSVRLLLDAFHTA